MEHEEAVAYVIQYLLGAEQDQARLRSATAHIAGCRDCLALLDTALSLMSNQPAGLSARAADLLTCEECRAQLPEYAETDMARAPGRYPRVARHLATCAVCLEHLTLLREWTALPFPEPSSAPLWQNIGALSRRIAGAIPILLNQGAVRFGQLAAGLQVAQFAAVPVRGSSAPALTGLHLDDPPNQVSIEIRLASQTQLAVRLNFTGPRPSGEPGRVIVARQAQLLQRMPLQAGAEAKLPLQPGQLLIRIEFGEKSWEIPLTVSEEGE